MFGVLLTSAAVLAIAGPPRGLADPQSARPDALTAVRPSRDSGEVPEGEPINDQFRLTNRSSGPVTFSGVTAGCACQAAGGLPDALAAGASVELSVTMKTRGRAGRQRGWWAVNYAAAGGEKGRLLLSLTATVTAAGKLEPTPPVAQLGAAELGEPVAAAVVLAEREPGGDAIKILSAEGPAWLSVKVQEAAGDGPPRFRLRLSGTPPAVPGRAGGAVRVLTDHPRYSLIEVPFEALVRGRADVTPRSLVQIVGAAAPRPAAAAVRGRNGAAVTGVTAAILDGNGDPDEDAGPIPLPDGAIIRDGDAWRVTVPGAPADGPRARRRTLRLAVTTDAGDETHDLPLLTLRPAAAAAGGDLTAAD